MNVDLLVRGGTFLTMDDRAPLWEDGAIAIHGGEILAVGAADGVTARFTGVQEIDASNCLVLPGLINTHTHLAMTLLRGRADDVTLQGFLERVVRWESELLTPGNVAAAVRLAAAESLKAGVTSALDMYWFHEAAQDAAREAGWRLLTGPTFMDVPEPPDGMGFEERIAWARKALEAYRASEENPPQDPQPGSRNQLALRPTLFAHSAYTLSPAQLTQVFALGREFGALLHIHAAENATEVATVEVKYGKRPVELLDSLGLLGPDVLLAHAVDLTGPEIAALARTGTSVAHCPVSNLKLGCGIAPVPRLLSAGVTVGLGTDGAVSSNSLDVLDVVRQAALVHKAGGDPTLVGAEQAVRMATIEGARALGLGDRLGSLEYGKRADLIVVSLDGPHVRPLHDPWSTLAYAARASDVRDTVVDGRVLMRERELTTLDERAVVAELESVIAGLGPGPR